MAKQTSSRTSGATSKRKTSEAPGPMSQVMAKPETRLDSGLERTATAAKPQKTAASKPMPSHEAIALRAYQLYQTRQPGDGSDMNDWLRAESDLRI